jgi:hypothetical protein
MDSSQHQLARVQHVITQARILSATVPAPRWLSLACDGSPVGDGTVYPAHGGWEKGWQNMPDDVSMGDGVDESTADGAVATAVRKLLGGLRLGEPLCSGALTLAPLLPANGNLKRQTGYLPLEEALQRKLVVISEQAQAQVPELLATSTADSPVILVGGEQVIGGLQNRVLNTTILVAAQSELRIPVTCVEAGRWHEFYEGYEAPTAAGDDESEQSATARADKRAFAAEEAAYSSLRKLHSKAVTASLSAGSGHRSDQSAVWNEVHERMVSSAAYSPSGAMHALYKAPERAKKLKETMDGLRRPVGALGFVATLGSDVLGAELFTDEALADAYWEKLARTYAVEALDAGEPTTQAAAETPDEASKARQARLLEQALAAEIQVHPSPGLGADARLVGSQVSGAGLVYDGSVVHLSLFPEDEDSDEALPQMTRRHYYGRPRPQTQPANPDQQPGGTGLEPIEDLR